MQAIDKLFRANGVDTDMETALFFADHNIQPAESLSRAQAAYPARPSIHTADVLGWVMFKQGRTADAQKYALESVKLATGDRLKLFHAEMFAQALGKNDAAKDYLTQPIQLNPHFSLLYHDRAQSPLSELGG